MSIQENLTEIVNKIHETETIISGMKIHKSELTLTNEKRKNNMLMRIDFKELGLTNEKQRNAHIETQMQESKERIMELENSIEVHTVELSHFKRILKIKLAMLENIPYETIWSEGLGKDENGLFESVIGRKKVHHCNCETTKEECSSDECSSTDCSDVECKGE